jgi:hypothetical protein
VSAVPTARIVGYRATFFWLDEASRPPMVSSVPPVTKTRTSRLGIVISAGVRNAGSRPSRWIIVVPPVPLAPWSPRSVLLPRQREVDRSRGGFPSGRRRPGWSHDGETARGRRTGAAGRGAAAPGRHRPGPWRPGAVRGPGLGARIRGAAGARGAGRRSGVSAAGIRSLPAHRLGHRRPGRRGGGSRGTWR